MRLSKIWVIVPILTICLLTGCIGYSAKKTETTYSDGRAAGYTEGYNDGYYNGYEKAYEDAREEFIDDLYCVDGYSPVYMNNEIMDDLIYLVEERGGNSYRPEEYAIIVHDFFSANSHNMTAEQIEAFENILTFCSDAEWVLNNIADDISFPPH